MPISWSLDDHPHFEFIRTPQTVAPGLQPARDVMQSWHDEFLYMKKTVDWGVLTYTMHPYVIGRGYRMLALEDLVAKLAAGGAVFMTMEQAAEEAKARSLRPHPEEHRQAMRLEGWAASEIVPSFETRREPLLRMRSGKYCATSSLPSPPAP